MKENPPIYPWLLTKINNKEVILTSSSYLARDLLNEYDKSQLRLQNKAWISPKIYFWRDWMKYRYLNNTKNTSSLVLDENISHILWEQCFLEASDDPLINVQRLATEAQDTFKKLCDYCVPFNEMSDLDNTEESRLFSNVLQLYLSRITQNNWLDPSLLINHLLQHEPQEWLEKEDYQGITFVGFYDAPPILDLITDSLKSTIEVEFMDHQCSAVNLIYKDYKDLDAEYRSVGAWVKSLLKKDPDSKIAVLVNDTHKIREIRYLIMEGLSPGWQYNTDHDSSCISDSRGDNLNIYPIIFTCMLLLRWYQSPLSSKELSLLLRSSLFQGINTTGSNSIEGRLRLLPERDWHIEEFLEVFNEASSQDELEVIVKIAIIEKTKTVRDAKLIREWLEILNDDLGAIGWPGINNPSDHENQLLTNWHEIFNQLENTQIIHKKVTLTYLINRLLNAIEGTVFRPKNSLNCMSVLSYEEASGMEFDYLWMSGMDNESWPKNGKSSSFIPFEIQRKFNMPDFHSSTSIIRQQKLLDSLSTAARHIIYSYSVNKNNLLLTFTSMIDFKDSDDRSCNDPDWYLLPFLNHNTRIIEEDTPKTQNNEYLAGGTNTVQSYITDPFSAFAKGRLLVKPLNRFMSGIGPLLRGSLIHDSLAELYSTLPSLKDIQSWSEKEKQSRIEKAVNEIFNKEIRGSNSILKRIFELEKSRAETILHAFLMEEVKRDYFQINEVEKKLTFAHANLNLHLRVDRVDLQKDDTFHVIDYKTGAAKNIIDMRNNIVSFQLFVYAAAMQKKPSTLSFINLKDTQTINFITAGLHDFKQSKNNKHKSMDIESGIHDVREILNKISAGDTRINFNSQLDQNNRLRYLHVLSRVQEHKNES